MKKRISFLLAAVLILAVLLPALPVLAEGENTFKADDANPTISTAADYIAFFKAAFVDGNTFEGKTISLLNDVTLNETSSENWYAQASNKIVGKGESAWSWFKGIFDGNDHTIKGAVIEGTFRYDGSGATYEIGLFPYVGNGTVIKNLTVDGIYICNPNTSRDVGYGKGGTGSLVGHADGNITIDNVVIKNGIVTCAENGKAGLGALIGTYRNMKNNKLIITNTIVEDSVRVVAGTGSTCYIGGLIGYVQDGWLSGGPYTFELDLSKSRIYPSGSLNSSNVNEVTLKPCGYFICTGNYSEFTWTCKSDKAEDVGFSMNGYDNTWYFNDRSLKSGCYGLAAAPVVRLAGTQTRASDNAVRFIGMLKIPESLDDVSQLGFEVTVGDVTKGAGDIKCTKVYTSVLENGVQKNAPDGYYYFTFALTDVKAGTVFTVRACATVGGTVCTTTAATYTYTPAE